jgi:hypothetical protein
VHKIRKLFFLKSVKNSRIGNTEQKNNNVFLESKLYNFIADNKKAQQKMLCFLQILNSIFYPTTKTPVAINSISVFGSVIFSISSLLLPASSA